MGKKLRESQSVFKWDELFKRDVKTWNVMKEVVVKGLTEPMKMLKSVESKAFR
jgi:hypothetical protein